MKTIHRSERLLVIEDRPWLIGILMIVMALVFAALAALFAVLAVEQWRTRNSSAPLWVALVSYAIASFLAPEHALVLSIALSVAAGLFWSPRAANAAREVGHD